MTKFKSLKNIPPPKKLKKLPKQVINDKEEVEIPDAQRVEPQRIRRIRVE